MTGIEYIQLKAFARVDGALLAVWLVAGFACYVLGLSSPGYGLAALALGLTAPFLVGWRLKKFRDDGLDGHISFLRGWGYVMFVFFYSGLLFALAQYGYFTYLDKGYMMSSLTQMMAQPENSAMLQQLGMTRQMNDSLSMMGSMRPIDWSLNALTMLLAAGVIVGLPIAAILKRDIETKL